MTGCTRFVPEVSVGFVPALGSTRELSLGAQLLLCHTLPYTFRDHLNA